MLANTLRKLYKTDRLAPCSISKAEKFPSLKARFGAHIVFFTVEFSQNDVSDNDTVVIFITDS